MGKTTISWTDESVNPLRARNRETGAEGHFCEKISPGCAHCYSAEMNVQQRFIGTGLDFIPQNREKVELYLDEKKLEQVRRRKKPTKYFWADMTDLFAEWVSDDWLNQCFRVMAETPQHTHQLLTKRPARMLQYINQRWQQDHAEAICRPLANVWLGVSVEDQQRADERIPLLLRTPAAVRFLSVEPLLGPVNLSHWFDIYKPRRGDGSLHDEMPWSRSTARRIERLHWVIMGGESGRQRRLCELTWIESLYQQCQAAGVAFWCKQDAALRPGERGRIPLPLWETKQFPTVETAS